MNKIAFIAAFPPPVTGQSLAADLLKKGLAGDDVQIFELDLAEPIGGESLPKRLYHLAKVEGRLLFLCIRHRDMLVYMQVGHGKLALIRDLAFMLTALVTRHPVFGHVHGSGFRDAFQALPQPIRAIEAKCIHSMAGAIVLSDSLKAMFEGLIDSKKIYAVDNGIDPDFVNLTQDNISIKENPRHILFLSNFLTAKGFSTLLKAAKIAKDNHKDWQFSFIGKKIERQDVDIDIYIQNKHLDNVIVRDVVLGQAKHEAYRDADVFVLPSSYEGQPLCILEAMFESLPVVTTRVGGIPEIFSDETGVRYVAPHDPQQLYHTLEILLSDADLLTRMGQANRRLALSRFTASVHVARMKEILLNYSKH